MLEYEGEREYHREALLEQLDPIARGVMIMERFKDIVYDREDSIAVGLFRAARELGFGEDFAGVECAVFILTGERIML